MSTKLEVRKYVMRLEMMEALFMVVAGEVLLQRGQYLKTDPITFPEV